MQSYMYVCIHTYVYDKILDFCVCTKKVMTPNVVWLLKQFPLIKYAFSWAEYKSKFIQVGRKDFTRNTAEGTQLFNQIHS